MRLLRRLCRAQTAASRPLVQQLQGGMIFLPVYVRCFLHRQDFLAIAQQPGKTAAGEALQLAFRIAEQSSATDIAAGIRLIPIGAGECLGNARFQGRIVAENIGAIFQTARVRGFADGEVHVRQNVSLFLQGALPKHPPQMQRNRRAIEIVRGLANDAHRQRGGHGPRPENPCWPPFHTGGTGIAKP